MSSVSSFIKIKSHLTWNLTFTCLFTDKMKKKITLMYYRPGNTYSAIIDNKCLRTTSMVSLLMTWNTHLVSCFREKEKDLFCKFYQARLNTSSRSQFVFDNSQDIGIDHSPAFSYPSIREKMLKNNFNKVQINYQQRSTSFREHLFSV